ncbi:MULTISPECIES: IclR family transcriptional regulator [Microtetraspora]|uniref:IclR family transcriptional regulator n=1 Tax=Microtetraspora glauca TaxID=1996 RepID=A0ABV3GI27_MICGL|nr:IclR family transcriptional regulator [Microtetraspora sp. AC03309]MCC5581221.1 IclR family transcriptional regulator [Microtetraspora sp. AC03309]
MSGSLARGLAVLKVLATEIDGLPLNEIAQRLDLPKSAAHRALAELAAAGFTQQVGPQGNYAISLRFTSLALRHLGQYPLVDLAKPALQRLAAVSGELVRLSIVEDDRLFWVEKRQGARNGLRYDDPDMGAQVMLSCSATGIAWLAHQTDARVSELAAAQGYPKESEFGARAPRDEAELMEYVVRAREQGYAFVDAIYKAGLAGMAAAIVPAGASTPVGVISIAGPSVRLDRDKAESLAPELLREIRDLEGLLSGV